jgi:hypothetical protein
MFASVTRWTRSLGSVDCKKARSGKDGWSTCTPCVHVPLVLRKDLLTVSQTVIKDPDVAGGKAAVDFYFIEDDGGMFKCTYLYEPYFYIVCKVCLNIQ